MKGIMFLFTPQSTPATLFTRSLPPISETHHPLALVAGGAQQMSSGTFVFVRIPICSEGVPALRNVQSVGKRRLRNLSKFPLPFVGARSIVMHSAAATFGRLRHAPTLASSQLPSDSCTSSTSTSRASQVRFPSPVSAGARASSGRAAAAARRGRGRGEQRFPVGEYGERVVVASYDDDDDDAVENEGDLKLECDESGCVVVKTTSKTLEEEDYRTGFLCCDVTGCYFADEPAAENTFKVLEGAGWRLGYETAPESEESFCAIVGAGGWSLALTASEFNDFCYLIQTLRKGISTMDQDGIIGKDEVVMQVERGSLWMECSIPKKRVAIFQHFWKLGNRALVDSQQKTAFKLRFLLSGASGRRQAEGFWPSEAVMDMLKKIDAMNLDQEDLANVQKAVSA